MKDRRVSTSSANDIVYSNGGGCGSGGERAADDAYNENRSALTYIRRSNTKQRLFSPSNRAIMGKLVAAGISCRKYYSPVAKIGIQQTDPPELTTRFFNGKMEQTIL